VPLIPRKDGADLTKYWLDRDGSADFGCA